ncbi:hypothetical protein TV39_08955 [Arthrobacter sp. SPG23]|nr:hypothetical protein TV39_08955 [Arthrobacter sp. SPG23]
MFQSELLLQNIDNALHEERQVFPLQGTLLSAKLETLQALDLVCELRYSSLSLCLVSRWLLRFVAKELEPLLEIRHSIKRLARDIRFFG